MSETSPQLPEIYTFIQVRDWLSGVFEALKASDPSMTHRSFSKVCGYKSSGGISLILSGKRRLTESGARRIARAVGLSAVEAQHLMLMVAFEQAEDFEERSKLLGRMRAAQRFSEVWADTLRSYAFYGEWYLPVLREMVSLPDFVEDPKWISGRISARLSPKAATEGIARLVELGFLTRDESGRLKPVHQIIATPSEVRSDVLKRHQRDMMGLAGEALDTQPRQERDMRVMTVAISRGQAERIKARLTQLHKELLEIVSQDEPIEQVYQLNTQWFALTNPPSDEGGTP